MGTIQDTMIRTRIAPSPTGYPHIGTIYQALFNYGFAKKYEGQFLIRIEDTDRSRFVEDAEEKIFSSIDWFGLVEDESPRKPGPFSPYRQSERLDIYKKYIDELLEKKKAYFCFCTKERLDEMRKKQQEEGKQPMYDKHCALFGQEEVLENLKNNMPHVVRMVIPSEGKIKFRDEIRGDIEFDSSTIDDQVILKSDGFPTYHLAVVVDDHLMEITHVLRGEEWLSSTPKHWLLYEYFGWQKPLFFHTPVLRNPDKSKLSKRQGHTNVEWYKDEGFLPEAILNYLALMGWSHPEEKEKFDLKEFIQHVELKDLKPVGPIFDIVKLTWLNGAYIMDLSGQDLEKRSLEFDPAIGELVSDYDTRVKFAEIAKTRMKTLKDFKILIEPFYKKKEIALTQEQEGLRDELKKVLSEIGEWTEVGIKEKILDTFIFSKRYKFPDLYQVLIGDKQGLPIAETLAILGKEKSLSLLT